MTVGIDFAIAHKKRRDFVREIWLADYFSYFR
jgi:hypothetical protein